MKNFLAWIGSLFRMKKTAWKPPLRKDYDKYVRGQKIDQLPPKARAQAMMRVLKNRSMFE